jgi:hypothetical protein
MERERLGTVGILIDSILIAGALTMLIFLMDRIR